jgi:hypothetical protein
MTSKAQNTAWSPNNLASQRAKIKGKESTPDWKEHLPENWMDAIDPPLYFEQYSEYEMPAERSVGYDCDDRPCFTAHQFMLTSLASDDDEEFYEIISYSEQMSAWRMRDERWLIFRIITTGNGSPPKGFYAISPEMPR